ncbi:hypothetical protein NFHSH190041_32970 [Shewanella sp. NFH-SH190041]|uniref:hypothetical protein n=1 Tax=Shewanella sp. NFH-SH190041 TaxID=2950245 RepID=UPI0021C39EB9|nr:hypothetical protein [Shewanella sp. NFH-SH190041]BDM65845.1 hypothetical protein NFHSH190041_32970 [Shewanella sp. NFH-SH190041]
MYQEYMSEYLIDGYKKSQFDLANIQFIDGGLTAELQYNVCEDNGGFEFHISAIDIFVAIQQMVVIYSAKINNMKENRKEVLLKTITMNFDTMLTQKSVKVTIFNIAEVKQTDRFIVYTGEYDVADGASSGSSVYMQLI